MSGETSMSLPDPAPVLDLIESFRRSKTMFAAVAMGVFDRLESSPATVEKLAADLSAEAEPLERLLDGCVGLGLLQKQGPSTLTSVLRVHISAPGVNARLRAISSTPTTFYLSFGAISKTRSAKEGTGGSRSSAPTPASSTTSFGPMMPCGISSKGCTAWAC